MGRPGRPRKLRHEGHVSSLYLDAQIRTILSKAAKAGKISMSEAARAYILAGEGKEVLWDMDALRRENESLQRDLEKANDANAELNESLARAKESAERSRSILKEGQPAGGRGALRPPAEDWSVFLAERAERFLPLVEEIIREPDKAYEAPEALKWAFRTYGSWPNVRSALSPDNDTLLRK